MKRFGSFILMIALLLIISGCSNQPDYSIQTYEGRVETKNGIFIDSSAMTLTFGEDTSIVYDGGTIAVGGTTHSLLVFSEGDNIYYDQKSGRLTSVRYDENILLGRFHTPLHQCQFHMNQALLFVNEISAPVLQMMQDDKVVFLGDSITEGHGTTKVFTEYLTEMCGFGEIVNYGLSGSCISPKVDEIPQWEMGIPSFYERVDEMDDDADIVVVFGGINDWVTGRELGTINDKDSKTFYGAMRLMCKDLKEKYPDATVVIFSSTQSAFEGRPANSLQGTPWEGNKEGYNRKGFKMIEYSDAMKEVCQAEDVHFYSLTEALPWGVEELGDNNGVDGLYSSDGLHPNADGHAVMALEMCKFICKVLAEG